MTDVTIDRLRARYRIPAGTDVERGRLDGILDRAFESAVDTALALAGVRDGELVCVRELHVPFRADLSRTEGALAGEWAEAFSRALRESVREGGERAVRYRSPSAALVDVARSAARDDFGSAWAWSSLGLWDAGTEPTREEAARGVADALASRPELAAQVVEAAADDGVTARFLLDSVDAGGWRRVAHAALDAAGLPRGLASTPEATTEGGRAGRDPAGRIRGDGRDAEAGDGPGDRTPETAGPGVGGTPGGPDARGTSRVPAAAAEASLVRSAGRLGLDPGAAPALAVLALLARSPTRLRRSSDAAGVVRALARRIRETGAESARAPGAGRRRPGPEERDSGRSRRAEADGPPARGEGERLSRTGEAGGGEDAAPRERPEPGGGETDALSPEPGREEARTAHGGLPFLLHILDDAETRAGLLDEPALDGRSLRWILHRLGMRLTGAPDDDPAVLAFCGLGPGDEPPSRRGEPPGPDEEEPLESGADRLRHDLRELLDAGDRSPAAVTREVVRREATVAADPGWIEVRLSLRDVAPEIRKAGLDLDPDFLEWLGVVVRFAYA